MLRKIFKNRYGIDRLSFFLAFFSLGFILSRFLWPIGLIMLGYAFFRAYSMNFAKRQIELQKFQTIMYKIALALNKVIAPMIYQIRSIKEKIESRKNHKYLKCRYCRKKLRLPRNKGKIKVSCPNCKNQFITKT